MTTGQLSGGCHCGAVRYVVTGAPLRHSVCHCSDCRRSAGAPFVAWMLYPRTAVDIHGTTQAYASSAHGRRHFCPLCGTGLFYTNEVLFPGETDVQSATLDDPGALGPTEQVQVAERLAWIAHLTELRSHDRYPESE